jgi:hypothetical protein
VPKLYFFVTTYSKQDCGKKFCTYCKKKQPFGHFCYVAPLKATNLSEKYIYVCFVTERTQDLETHDGPFEHVPNIIFAQQMYYKCVTMDDMNVDCEQCGSRTHVFWQEPVGKFIELLSTI